MQPHPTTRRKWLLSLVALCLVGPSSATAAETSPVASEYQVKAAFLYNFTKFAVWPPSAFQSATAPLVIGILGQDPFGQTMDDVVRGETVGERPLVVKRLSSDNNLRACHLLFISHSEKERLSAVLSQLEGSPVLSVSEIDGFASQGGMVNLLLANKTVKMEINQAAAERAGLQISAKLLKLARLVKS
jgi:hypothetical protein